MVVFGTFGALVVVFGTFGAEGRWFESRPGCHVGTLSKFLVHNALQYNCICTTEALNSDVNPCQCPCP